MKLIILTVSACVGLAACTGKSASALSEPALAKAIALNDQFGTQKGRDVARQAAASRSTQDIYVYYKYLRRFGGDLYDINDPTEYSKLENEELSALKCGVDGANSVIIDNINGIVSDRRTVKYTPERDCLSGREKFPAIDNYNVCHVDTATPPCFLDSK